MQKDVLKKAKKMEIFPKSCAFLRILAETFAHTS